MPEALEGLSKEELLSYAKMLLSGAIDRIDMDMPDQAAWRVANALGCLAGVLVDTTATGLVPGIHTKTNLGYRLEAEDDNTKSLS